jgi:hypothetical protein
VSSLNHLAREASTCSRYLRAGRDEAGAEADRAMNWLKKAVTAGWNKPDHIGADHDLDALRYCEDFKELMRALTTTPDKKQ